MNKRTQLMKDESGMSLLEYAVGAALLMGIVVGAMNIFGTGLTAYFSNLGNFLTSLTFST
ncbi:MAG: Flp family type IVb pilin [bacterium]|nr:Flp family type IVb pilin [bacterium]